eukprot:Phypoly_transcript_10741.p1 GENE.Phypoly_transcript_10741~~Phypoly_transcript_10741.p1  ORF type:complete len:317 (+),score=39.27 Phypoly_transcript_10741:219-1169(+)
MATHAAVALIDIPLPSNLQDPIHGYNQHLLEHVLPLTTHLYVHYFYHALSPSITLENIQQILGSTYQILLQHNIHNSDVVIPPRAGYDPLRSLPNVSIIYTSQGHFFTRDLKVINSERIVRGLSEVTEQAVLPAELPKLPNNTPIVSSLPSVEFVPMFDGVVLGGTYDRLHAGHKMMLTVATMICRKHMEIGVTSETLLGNKKFKELIEPYDIRATNVLKFVKTLNPNPTLNIVIIRLEEPYANTMTSKILQAIVVSPETEKVGVYINEVRMKSNLPPLQIIPIQYIPPPTSSQSDQIQLSSTLLRQLEYEKRNQQ